MATLDYDEKKLLELFDEGYTLFNSVSNCEEPTNSAVIQNKIKQAMRILEEATRITSMAGIFSANEDILEVATENLKLFLLPALLGTLALKLTVRSRIEVVETSDIYFRDFLQRCNDYNISNVNIPPPVLYEEGEDKIVNKRPMFDMVGAARTRATKIQRFKEEKALEEELKTLMALLKSGDVDEDVQRDYYLKLIKSYVSKAEEELDCLQSEKQILAHMKSVFKDDSQSNNSEESKKRRMPPPKPLMPVIITKDEVQKAVIGAGYPSLPTMTVQEFYDKRVQEGIFPPANRSLLDESKRFDASSSYSKEDIENEQKEVLIEKDDSVELARQREMDEFKDENKRGWGNRYNRS